MIACEWIAGTLLLRCQNGKSDKEYRLIGIHQTNTSGATESFFRTRYGPTGNLRSDGALLNWGRTALKGVLKAKMAKGYEIVSVNDRPFTSGFVDEAVDLVFGAVSFDGLSTNQPPQRIRARHVELIDRTGKCAPIW